MSYDLKVFTKSSLDAGQMDALLGETGLRVADRSISPMTVLRGKRPAYSFTLSVDALEVEDVPAEITALAIGVQWLYEVIVEGSDEKEVPHAIRFARRLAKATAGVVHDPQNDTTWSQGKLRSIEVVRDKRIDVVNLTWFTVDETILQDLAIGWLACAHRYLPEALPRRFGSYEPLPGSLQRDGNDAFVEAARHENLMLFIKGSGPCIDGKLPSGSNPYGQTYHSASLTIQRRPLDQADWRDAARRFFVAIAETCNSFYAFAEVQQNVGWSSRSLWFDRETEASTHLINRQGWCGLPPRPVWWSWFGEIYKPYVERNLDSGTVSHMNGGLLWQLSECPASRKELEDSVQWLPGELLTVADPINPYIYPPTIHLGATIPEPLRKPYYRPS